MKNNKLHALFLDPDRILKMLGSRHLSCIYSDPVSDNNQTITNPEEQMPLNGLSRLSTIPAIVGLYLEGYISKKYFRDSTNYRNLYPEPKELILANVDRDRIDMFMFYVFERLCKEVYDKFPLVSFLHFQTARVTPLFQVDLPNIGFLLGPREQSSCLVHIIFYFKIDFKDIEDVPGLRESFESEGNRFYHYEYELSIEDSIYLDTYTKIQECIETIEIQDLETNFLSLDGFEVEMAMKQSIKENNL